MLQRERVGYIQGNGRESLLLWRRFSDRHHKPGFQHALIKRSAVLLRVFMCYGQHGRRQWAIGKIRLIIRGRGRYFGLGCFTTRWAGTLLVLPPDRTIEIATP